jgi:hypothetical protein
MQTAREALFRQWPPLRQLAAVRGEQPRSHAEELSCLLASLPKHPLHEYDE